jgi:hypothetical protein
VKARTNDEFQAAINDAAPVDYDGNPQLAPAGAPSRLERLVIQPGESGGLLTNSEFVLAKFCTEEKLKKKTSDRLISMIKQRAFVIEDIHADSIREIEKMISDSSSSKISEFDLWRKIDGKQDVKVYLRSLRRIIEELVAHLGYRNCQYLHFEYKEINGERVFGAANGGIWWQITVRQIGTGHVLLAIIVFQDGSWVKMNLSCEPLYGEFSSCFEKNFQSDFLRGVDSDSAKYPRVQEVQERSF